MLTAIFTRRLLTALAVAVLLATACVLLARWQWSRFEEKDARARAVESNYRAAAVPLAEVLPTPSVQLGEARVWSRVSVSGRYADRYLLVRGRTLDGAVGMEVLVPLRIDGGVLLVDRGWVPIGADAATLPSVPATPAGTITVSGWLKPSEDGDGTVLPAGQLKTIDLAQARQQVDGPVYSAYLVLAAETAPDGSAPPRPAPLAAPSTDRGPHVAYAVQWSLTALLGFAFVVLVYRTDRTDPRPDRPVKPKKVRIWDEEDG
ncbi:MAG: SURF1 family protein [Dermatophilaceae bacterium]